MWFLFYCFWLVCDLVCVFGLACFFFFSLFNRRSLFWVFGVGIMLGLVLILVGTPILQEWGVEEDKDRSETTQKWSPGRVDLRYKYYTRPGGVARASGVQKGIEINHPAGWIISTTTTPGRVKSWRALGIKTVWVSAPFSFFLAPDGFPPLPPSPRSNSTHKSPHPTQIGFTHL